MLDPLDLYHLGSVSKDFHSLIYSTTKIWSTIYRHGQIPKAPVELTNEEWVDLLFGPVICDVIKILPFANSKVKAII